MSQFPTYNYLDINLTRAQVLYGLNKLNPKYMISENTGGTSFCWLGIISADGSFYDYKNNPFPSTSQILTAYQTTFHSTLKTYSLKTLGLSQQQFIIGLQQINNNFKYEFNPGNFDAFKWWGVPIIGTLDYDITNNPIPSTADIFTAYNNYNNTLAAQEKKGTVVSQYITTPNKEFTFVSSTDGTIAVKINSGSNSVSTVISSDNFNNPILTSDTDYIDKISNLNIYNYKVNTDPNCPVRIGFLPADWDKIAIVSDKDPSITSIELMDVISVLLTTIKNLNRRVSILESKPGKLKIN